MYFTLPIYACIGLRTIVMPLEEGISAPTGLNCGVDKFILQMKQVDGMLIANSNGWITWNIIPNHNLKPPILST